MAVAVGAGMSVPNSSRLFRAKAGASWAKSDLLCWAASCTLRDLRSFDDLRDGAVYVELFALAWPRAVERLLSGCTEAKAARVAKRPAYAAWDVMQALFKELQLPQGVLDIQGVRAGTFKACYPLLVLSFVAATLASLPFGEELCYDFAHPVPPLLADFLASPKLVRSLQKGGGIPPLNSNWCDSRGELGPSNLAKSVTTGLIPQLGSSCSVSHIIPSVSHCRAPTEHNKEQDTSVGHGHVEVTEDTNSLPCPDPQAHEVVVVLQELSGNLAVLEQKLRSCDSTWQSLNQSDVVNSAPGSDVKSNTALPPWRPIPRLKGSADPGHLPISTQGKSAPVNLKKCCSSLPEGLSASADYSCHPGHHHRGDIPNADMLLPGPAMAPYTVQSPGGTPSFSRNISSSELHAINPNEIGSQSSDAGTSISPLDVPSIWERLKGSDCQGVEDHFHLHLHTSCDSLCDSPRNPALSARHGEDSPVKHQHNNFPSEAEHLRFSEDLRRPPPDLRNEDVVSSSQEADIEQLEHGIFLRRIAASNEQMRLISHLPPNVLSALEDSRRKRSELLQRCQQHSNV